MEQNLRDTLLNTIEASLQAQLMAVRRLRLAPDDKLPPPSSGVKRRSRQGMSQVDMAYHILAEDQPLHIREILAAIRKRFEVEIDRESLVSALSKRVARKDRFKRIGKNIFAKLPAPPSPS
jgi:hypothetical protein